MKERNLCIYDMGVGYFGYGSDVMCYFPVGGVFDSRQRAVYQRLFDVKRVVLCMINPSESWTDCHTAEAEVLRVLIKLGRVILIDGKSLESLGELRVELVLMPHGL